MVLAFDMSADAGGIIVQVKQEALLPQRERARARDVFDEFQCGDIRHDGVAGRHGRRHAARGCRRAAR